MIHISRLVGETLMIGDNLSVTVVAVEGDEVMLEINNSDGSHDGFELDHFEYGGSEQELLACAVGAE